MQRVIERSSLPGEEKAAPKLFAGSKVRIYSALVLGSLTLLLTIAGVESFTLLIVLFTAAMAWEWGRLVRGEGLDLAFGIQVLATSAASWQAARGCPSCALLAVVVGALTVFLLWLMKGGRPQAWWSAAGVYYAGLPAVALIWFRTDAGYGALTVLYLFAIVWTTDSTAFLFGRWIGGPKLAPRISPKKTWSGLIGATLSSGMVGAVFGLIAGLSSLWLGILAVGFALIAQLGDLGESAVKRIFDIKDSSGLIPGHGGVLDRIDGLVFAAIAAALLAWGIDPTQPGQALLVAP